MSFGREAELPFTRTDARKISAGLLAIAKTLVLAHQLVSDCPDLESDRLRHSSQYLLIKPVFTENWHDGRNCGSPELANKQDLRIDKKLGSCRNRRSKDDAIANWLSPMNSRGIAVDVLAIIGKGGYLHVHRKERAVKRALSVGDRSSPISSVKRSLNT